MSVAIESDTMLQYMKRVLKTYANSKTLASMRLMRSLSEPLRLKQQVGPTNEYGKFVSINNCR